jgi:Ca2+-binding RTX toxin-like protein
VDFADGTQWSQAQLTERCLTITGSDAAETLTGTDAYGDTLLGLGGNDILNGLGGNDRLVGDAGNDTLSGGEGGDTLDGGTGDDVLDGGNGNDVLSGGAGNDVLRGGGDQYYGGSDTYLYNLGGGVDTIEETFDYNNAPDVLKFGEGISVSDIQAVRVGNHLELRHSNGSDKVIVGNWFASADVRDRKLERVDFADGTQWSQAQLTERCLTITGSDAAETLTGTDAYGDTLHGHGGNDTLSGGNGNDKLFGDAGNDTLIGGTGNDTYAFKRGDGVDLSCENDSTSGNSDLLLFDGDITADQLWFSQNGNNLDVAIIGTDEKVSIQNWYLSKNYHVEQFKTADGKTLIDSQVQQLVNAMASLTPPAAGETTLPESYQSTLNPVIAANWK